MVRFSRHQEPHLRLHCLHHIQLVQPCPKRLAEPSPRWARCSGPLRSALTDYGNGISGYSYDGNSPQVGWEGGETLMQ